MKKIKKICKSVFGLNLLKKGGMLILIFAIGTIQSFSNDTSKNKNPLFTEVAETSIKSPNIFRNIKNSTLSQSTSKDGESDAKL